MRKGQKLQRLRRADIECLVTKLLTIRLKEDQCFYETGAYYEIWQEGEFPCRIKKFSKKMVLWVITK